MGSVITGDNSCEVFKVSHLKLLVPFLCRVMRANVARRTLDKSSVLFCGGDER